MAPHVGQIGCCAIPSGRAIVVVLAAEAAPQPKEEGLLRVANAAAPPENSSEYF